MPCEVHLAVSGLPHTLRAQWILLWMALWITLWTADPMGPEAEPTHRHNIEPRGLSSPGALLVIPPMFHVKQTSSGERRRICPWIY